MKKNFQISFLLLICLSLVAFQCEDEITQEDDRAELNILKSEIENLANTSVCNENFECKIIGFGSKACGGPLGYLIYTSSINIKKLENLVKNYNQKENDFNIKWKVISDCSIINPPTRVTCKNNACVAIF